MTRPITWTEVYPGCEYRVHTPIGEFDAWSSPTAFVKTDAWFVGGGKPYMVRWHGQSFEQALDAIRAIGEETAS